jgi:enolase
VGGDLFGGNLKRLEKGIRLGAANAVSVRTGQTGTLTGMADLLKVAREAGYGVLLADQEGETADTLQADLAVAYGVSQIRFGAPGYAGNTEKYNQLLRICERLGKSDECGGEIC